MQWIRTGAVLAVVLGLLFAGWSFRSGNAGVIDLDLVVARLPNVEVWWALSLSLGLGMVLGGFGVGLAWLRQRILNRRYRKAIAKLEGELHALRSLPLAGSARDGQGEAERFASFGRS